MNTDEHLITYQYLIEIAIYYVSIPENILLNINMNILCISTKGARNKHSLQEKWNSHLNSYTQASVSVAAESEGLPVTVGAITSAGCLPLGFKPPPQQGTRRAVYLT